VTVSPAIASFIISIAPITTMIFAAIIWQEKVGLLKWTGILISLSGLVIIVLSSVGGVRLDYGVFYLLGSTLAASCFVLLQKPLLARYSPIVITAASIWGGSLLLAIYFPELLKQLPRASSQATLAVVYLGVFPAAIAYLCFSYALANLPVTQIAPYFYTMPIMTTLLSWLWLNEVPTLLAFSGGLLALSGVILAEQLPKIKAKKPRLTDKESA
jgi:drug/metabolite transporter (DMT)-like permease